MTRVVSDISYSEAHHTVLGIVTNADPITIEKRRFLPARISVTYDWRTQLGDVGWTPRLAEVSGPWIDEDGVATDEGTGRVLLPPSQAPQWARDFIAANVPRMALVER